LRSSSGRGLQIGCGVALEFATTDGHYCVTWAKENKQLSVAMPGGSMMYAVGNTVTFDPTDGSKKYDPLQSEDNERKHGPFTNTNGLYIFDVVEGSLLFTNNAGEGFKVFGQGTKFEGILGGKYESQIAKEAEDYEAALLAWASTTPDGLLDELDARAAAKNPDVEDPTPPSTAPPEFPGPRASVSGCQFLSTLHVALKVSTRSLNAFDSFVSFCEGHWASHKSPETCQNSRSCTSAAHHHSFLHWFTNICR
jgi:hypothetical protein